MLVYCSAGMSRSQAVVASFIMHEEGVCLNEALTQLPQHASPNENFLAQLLLLEKMGGRYGRSDASLALVACVMFIFVTDAENQSIAAAHDVCLCSLDRATALTLNRESTARSGRRGSRAARCSMATLIATR